SFRRAAWVGALAALAAGFLLAPLVPWKAVLLSWPGRETSHGAVGVDASLPRPEAAPDPAESPASASELLASAQSVPAPALPSAQDPGWLASPADSRLDRPAVAAAAAPESPLESKASTASQSARRIAESSLGGSGQPFGSKKASEWGRFKRAADEEFNTEA
ncbi:MAG TPA: hypothetical protein VIT18_06245, partial [Terrimicrobiaceae bacterium]